MSSRIPAFTTASRRCRRPCSAMIPDVQRQDRRAASVRGRRRRSPAQRRQQAAQRSLLRIEAHKLQQGHEQQQAGAFEHADADRQRGTLDRAPRRGSQERDREAAKKPEIRGGLAHDRMRDPSGANANTGTYWEMAVADSPAGAPFNNTHAWPITFAASLRPMPITSVGSAWPSRRKR